MVQIKHCRSCGSDELVERFSLGELAIIKFKDSPEEPDEKAPLTLLQCQKCTLVQLSETVNRDKVFRKYFYTSGINKTMRDELKDIVKDAQLIKDLEKDDWVVDIGSNDGTLLSFYPRRVHTLGFEPSQLASAQFSITIPNYFNAKEAKEILRGEKAKIITCVATFYSVDDPNKFLQDVGEILAEDGVFVLQVNYLGDLLNNLSIADIVHEHVCYYSIRSLAYLLNVNGFKIIQVDHRKINGGSIRFFVKKVDGEFAGTSERLFGDYEWKKFKERLDESINKIETFMVKQVLEKRKSCWGYGASTRGNTVLQYIQCASAMEAIADKNPKKWRKFMAGTNIEIKSEEEMRAAKPDILTILNPSFLDEFLTRESTFLRCNGKFLVLLPDPALISEGGHITYL